MADPKFYKNTGSQSLKSLAEKVGGEVKGDSSITVQDVAPLNQAGSSDISFLDNIKYKQDFQNTKAGACIVSEQMVEFAPADCHLIISKFPYKSYAKIAQIFYPDDYPEPQISEQAHIDPTAIVNDGCIVEAGAVIGAHVTLGKGCWIEANAVIRDHVEICDKCRIGAGATVSHAKIGASTRLYPGVRVGQDGFGFAIDPAGHVKVPQLGRVIIGDHVEIGANTTIDRGAGPDTIIGDGAWIDNLVQIGHNVKIGRGCVIIAQSGIAGSSTLEDFVVVAAQAGVAGHLTIGQGTQIAGQSGIMQDLPAGSKVMGYPALPIKQFMRQVAMLKKMTKK